MATVDCVHLKVSWKHNKPNYITRRLHCCLDQRAMVIDLPLAKSSFYHNRHQWFDRRGHTDRWHGTHARDRDMTALAYTSR